MSSRAARRGRIELIALSSLLRERPPYRWLWLSILLVLLAGCGRPSPGPHRLWEGRAWEGKISLGDPEERVIRLLGRSSGTVEDGQRRYYDYGYAEVTVDPSSGKVTSILLRGNWVTAAGASAGDPVEKIVGLYGAVPYHPPVLAYPQRGISFVLTPGEIVAADGSRGPGWVASWARIYNPSPER